jgi:hypothetical protein
MKVIYLLNWLIINILINIYNIFSFISLQFAIPFIDQNWIENIDQKPWSVHQKIETTRLIYMKIDSKKSFFFETCLDFFTLVKVLWMTCVFSSMIPNSESRIELLSLDVHRRVSDAGQSGVIGIRRNDLGGQHHHQQHQQHPQHHMLQQLTVPTSPPVIVNEMMQGIFIEILFQGKFIPRS